MTNDVSNDQQWQTKQKPNYINDQQPRITEMNYKLQGCLMTTNNGKELLITIEKY